MFGTRSDIISIGTGTGTATENNHSINTFPGKGYQLKVLSFESLGQMSRYLYQIEMRVTGAAIL